MAAPTAQEVSKVRVTELIKREEERFRSARPRSHQLVVDIGAGVDEHASVEQQRRPQPGVARVGRGALRTVTAQPRDRPGRPGAQHQRLQSSRSHLGWWRRAQSRRTLPSVIPRSEWRVVGLSSAR